MGSLADLTLGDIARALGRYKPVVLTVVGILVVVALAPGPRRAVGDALAGLPGPVRALPAAQDDAVGADPAAPGVDGAPPEVGEFGDDASSFSSGPSTFGPSGAGTSSGFGSGDDGDDTSGSEDFSGSDSGSFSGDDSSFSGGVGGDVDDAARPLTVVASATAANPTTSNLPGSTVPAGTLPVGKRFGQDDRYSYVRLAGDDTELVLAFDPAGTRTTSGVPSVIACRVTRENWPEGENKPLNEIPFDRTQCANGAREDAAGTYRFDLSPLGELTDTRGFALVPGPGAAVDFQVAFRKS